MQSMERPTLVGVFSDYDQAEDCVDELKAKGFREDQIGFMMQDPDRRTSETTVETEHHDSGDVGAGGGFLTGAVTGGLVGAAAALFIPAVGPVLAGGILASTLAGAAIGAVTGGVAASLIHLGVPEDEAHYYEGEFKSGRTLVSVKTEGRYDEARSIMESYGGYFDEATAATTRRELTDEPAVNYERSRMVDDVKPGAGQTIELKEEELHANKTPVQTGEVQVHKEVITENRTIDVPVTREEVVIERHAVDRPATGADFADRDQTLRIPVMEEQVNVEKTAVVREEIEIGKRSVSDTQRVSGDVRREEARIDRDGDVKVDGDETISEEERARRLRYDQERRSA